VRRLASGFARLRTGSLQNFVHGKPTTVPPRFMASLLVKHGVEGLHKMGRFHVSITTTTTIRYDDGSGEDVETSLPKSILHSTDHLGGQLLLLYCTQAGNSTRLLFLHYGLMR
jgi:hypothetical protein